MPGEQTFTISSALLDGVQAQDSQAWDRLVQLYGPVVYEWSRRAGLEPNSAADIVQETFRSVFTAVKGFRRDGDVGTFGGWLRTIVNNKIRDRARRNMSQGRAAGGTDAYRRILELPEQAELSDATAVSGFNVARQAIELVKNEYEPKTWQAFWQTTVDGRRADLVAEELGMSVGSVYTAKSRVLRRLREQLTGLS